MPSFGFLGYAFGEQVYTQVKYFKKLMCTYIHAGKNSYMYFF